MSAPIEIEDLCTLAPMQEGMLFESLVAPRAGTYVQQMHAQLVGPLDGARFAAAWQEVARRHGVLRSSFAWREIDVPHQVVARHVTLPFDWLDWSARPAAAQQRALHELMRRERIAGFEPSRAPLQRMVVIRLGDARHAFVWTYHHLLLDNWSEVRVLREVALIYAGLARGALPELPPALPYRRYVAWLKRHDPARAERFWRAALAGFAAPTPLPGLPGAAVAARVDEGLAVREATLPHDATAGLRALARAARVTPSTIVQAAWALLLAAAARVDDVVFGVVVRTRCPEVNDASVVACGLFVNTLPVRVRLRHQQALADSLRDLQAWLTAAREHEAVSLAQIRAWSELAPGAALFGSFVVAQNHTADSVAGEPFADLELCAAGYVQQSNYPLMVTEVAAAELGIRLTFDQRAIADEVVALVLAELVALLERMARAPQATVGDLLARTPLAARLAEDAAARGADGARRRLRASRRRPVALAAAEGLS